MKHSIGPKRQQLDRCPNRDSTPQTLVGLATDRLGLLKPGATRAQRVAPVGREATLKSLNTLLPMLNGSQEELLGCFHQIKLQYLTDMSHLVHSFGIATYVREIA